MFLNLLVEKYRPKTLADLVLSKENRKYFESLKGKTEVPNLLFLGSPGIGKTTLAKIIVVDILDCQYIYINASDESGIDIIRNKVKTFAQTRSMDGKIKICILDEADHLSTVNSGNGQTNAQAALRNLMEEYSGTTRFILTGNYKHKIIPALQSRCQDFDLTPPINESVVRCIEILKAEKIKVPTEEKEKLIQLIRNNYPDLRRSINALQKATINGVLHIIKEEDKKDFAKKLLVKIIAKTDLTDLRRYTIGNEILFNNNYHSLLKGLFEVIFDDPTLEPEKKRLAMLTVSESMYRAAFQMDQEIGAFACILNLFDLF